MLENCCAITGHRPNKFPWRYDETDSRCIALKAVLAEQIAALVNAGFTVIASDKMQKNAEEKMCTRLRRLPSAPEWQQSDGGTLLFHSLS